MTAWWTTIGADGAPSPGSQPGPERTEDAVSPSGLTRRSFLEIAGFGAAAVTVVSCEAPVRHALPLVAADEQIVPGKATWFASTCGGCAAACGVLLKVRDGRPIKVEGHPDHPVNGHPRRAQEAARVGGLCAVGQAASMSLYDSSRPLVPTISGRDVSWDVLDGRVRAGLRSARDAGKETWLVASASSSPSMRLLIDAFCERTGASRVVWDPLGPSSIAEAHRISHGRAVVPVERLEAASVVLSLGADLLGAGHSPAEHLRRWSEAHRPNRRAAHMGRWIQLEGRMSVTGAHADERHRVAPSGYAGILKALLRRLADDDPRLSELARAWDAESPEISDETLDRWATELRRHRGKALVVSDSEDVETQLLVNALNEAIGAYGATLDLSSARRWSLSRPSELSALWESIEAQRVGAVIVWDANPLHEWPDAERARRLMERVPLRVAITDRKSETAAACNIVAAAPHWLEAWSDAEPRQGVVAIAQPGMQAMGRTRAGQESLLRWMGEDETWLDWLRRSWARNVWPRAGSIAGFTAFWDGAVEHGFAEVSVPRWEAPSGHEPRYGDLSAGPTPEPASTEPDGTIAFHAAAVAHRLTGVEHARAEHAGLELVVHPSMSLRAGHDANNPWLQELPDPISKVSWTNHASVSPAVARRMGLSDGDLVVATANGRRIELPIIVQPGQHDRVVSIAAGYGRSEVGPVGRAIGANALSLAAVERVALRLSGSSVELRPTGARAELPRAQTEAGLHGRDHVRTATFADLVDDARAGNPRGARHLSIWPGHRYEGHRWAMAIDLSACVGCNGCVVACQVENNVPVVGPDEIARNREMTWLRIDRYYGGDDPDQPDVVHQPMMCQHCENAPCETVCPVLATVHSEEGLNQQVYNRCVGTRYCANNCPYKARRFNWFDYPHEGDTERLALNPDVVVRSRGVMEKCTFCVQRIQEAKWDARREGRPLADGEVQPACAQSCPSRAIVFGDLHDPTSEISRVVHGSRSYRVLHELNVIPSVTYQTRIKNTGEGT